MTSTDSVTMRGFVAKSAIRFAAALTDSNPNMADMPAGSTHWRCMLRRGKRRITVYFSQGPAISREPTAEDVLDCLASDAAGVENARSFEDWCGEYGYDTDSRKAERIYNVVRRQADALRRLLGDDLYNTLLWDTERL